MEQPKLYTAHTTISRYYGVEELTIIWFVQNRLRPVAPYQSIIAGYESLPVEDRLHMTKHADELFTADEIQVLQKVLSTHWGGCAQVCPVELPEKPFYLNDELLTGPWADMQPESGEGFYTLASQQEHSISIAGFYNITGCPTFHQPHEKSSEEFIEQFRWLSLNWNQMTADQQSILRYDLFANTCTERIESPRL